jgi:hypothetical protein
MNSDERIANVFRSYREPLDHRKTAYLQVWAPLPSSVCGCLLIVYPVLALHRHYDELLLKHGANKISAFCTHGGGCKT